MDNKPSTPLKAEKMSIQGSSSGINVPSKNSSNTSTPSKSSSSTSSSSKNSTPNSPASARFVPASKFSSPSLSATLTCSSPGSSTLSASSPESGGRLKALMSSPATLTASSPESGCRVKTVKPKASSSLALPSAEPGGRLKGVQVVKPIVYGNVSWYLGEKRPDGHTHQWKVYLKPYKNEDMSVYVKRVHFKLHESYADQNRVCHAPPYHVTETGWGEFEVTIKIFFQDSNERPVTLYHFLKLFDRGADGSVKMSTAIVNSEFYDELVFTDPTARMHKLLTNPKFIAPEQTHNVDYEEKKARDLEKILEGKKKVKEEIAKVRAQLAAAKITIGKQKSHKSS